MRSLMLWPGCAAVLLMCGIALADRGGKGNDDKASPSTARQADKRERPQRRNAAKRAPQPESPTLVIEGFVQPSVRQTLERISGATWNYRDNHRVTLHPDGRAVRSNNDDVGYWRLIGDRTVEVRFPSGLVPRWVLTFDQDYRHVMALRYESDGKTRWYSAHPLIGRGHQAAVPAQD